MERLLTIVIWGLKPFMWHQNLTLIQYSPYKTNNVNKDVSLYDLSPTTAIANGKLNYIKNSDIIIKVNQHGSTYYYGTMENSM